MRRAMVAGACGAILVAVSGCGTVYLHSDATQRITDGAAASYGRADVAGMFAAQKANLRATSARELGLVERDQAAQRRLTILSVLADRPPAEARTEARLYVDERFDVLLGRPPETARIVGAATGGPRARAEDLISFKLSRLRMDEARAERQIEDFRELHVRDFGAPAPACETPRPAALAPSAETWWVAFAAFCDQRAQARGRIAEFTAGLGAVRGSGLATALAEIDRASGEIREARGRAAALKAELQRLEAAFAAAPSQATAARIQAILSHDLIGQGAKPADAILRAAGWEALADRLQAVLTALLEADAGSAPTAAQAPEATSIYTRGALQVLRGAADFADAATGRVYSRNALIVGLAYARNQLAIEQIEVRRLEQRLGLLEDRREAIYAEIERLAAARRALDGLTPARAGDGMMAMLGDRPSGRAAAAALRQINESWVYGRLAHARADFLEVDNDRVAALAKEEANATARMAFLKAGIDELVDYGKGGIVPETVVGFLLALALIARV
ncbi:MAG: hypothetical protein AB7O45_03130 [Alphaproteobacteria bacterium]